MAEAKKVEQSKATPKAELINPIERPRDAVDKAFRIGLLLKMLDGLVETLGGILLLIIQPDQIDRLVHWLTQGELNHDPHDFIANRIVNSANHITGAGLTFGAIYLLAHGVVKIVLVYEVWRDHLWAYLGLIGVTALFVIYQAYVIVGKFSLGLFLLTIFDLVIIYLTQKEYRRQQARLHHERISDI